MVELHDDVGAQVALDAHHALRRERVRRAIDVAAKDHAVLAHRPQPLEREHLKSARVREDWPVPPHEPVQTPEIANQLVARAQVQMIRVAEYHLRAQLAQIIGVQRFDRRLRADRHERRRVDDAVRRRESRRRAAPRISSTSIENDMP